ncbi:hypothetical protein PanWU01x14_044360 [Parasponia andersonii]|uniref:Uncharacterized protein n=1 Tax=Parasponia andersonii TaxID=3476 RepID=A0A2P5DP78_PARAD|nr:hypothetical protein PanWU01x14_044360 [Parasponia andersonii]
MEPVPNCLYRFELCYLRNQLLYYHVSTKVAVCLYPPKKIVLTASVLTLHVYPKMKPNLYAGSLVGGDSCCLFKDSRDGFSVVIICYSHFSEGISVFPPQGN